MKYFGFTKNEVIRAIKDRVITEHPQVKREDVHVALYGDGSAAISWEDNIRRDEQQYEGEFDDNCAD